MKKWPIVLVAVAAVVALGIGLGYRLWNAPMPDPGRALIVSEKASMIWLEEQLVQEWKVDGKAFHINRQLLRMNNPEPGRYVVQGGESVFSFLRRLRSGQQDPVDWVVKEGPSALAVVGKMAGQLAVDSASLLHALRDTAILRSLQLTENQWSVYLIPNTYEVYYTDEADELAQRLKEEYFRFWTAERLQQAQAWKLSPQEVTILASIVEAETKQIDEMPTVAGLYLNRLKLGMPLQSDPTILFARRLEQPLFTAQRVYKKDLVFPSPYNTYIHPGLPPGPIGVPSIQALQATLNPQFHTFIYMCADPGRPGYHQFASNLKGHEHNRQRYIRWLNQNNIQ
jgi:UPF0755 protein